MRERGVYDETLIVVTSDHGEEFGERDGDFYDAHGHTLFEEMVHVPLIVKLPGQRRAGERVGTLTRAVDVMPTLLETLGAVPERHRMEGRDLLRDGATARSESPPAVSESLSRPFEAKSIRDERYKLIIEIDEEAVAASGRAVIPETLAVRQLYDLLRDPEERHDLLRSSSAADATTRAEAMERELRSRVGALRGQADRVVLGDEVLERLRALGYIQ
jgi:arylsulfatase A-like enzyme